MIHKTTHRTEHRMFSLSGRDWLAITVIILISYWIAFKTGLAEFIVPKRRRGGLKGHRKRGTITGEEKPTGPIIERVTSVHMRAFINNNLYVFSLIYLSFIEVDRIVQKV